jgi:hypothetical protein
MIGTGLFRLLCCRSWSGSAGNALGIEGQDRLDHAVIVVKFGALDDAALAGETGLGRIARVNPP